MLIGAYEAQSKFSELLDRVEAGESVQIARRGRVVAVLSPSVGEAPTMAELTASIQDSRRRVNPTPEEARAWTDEGRRW